jgi:hypothetical protein
VDDFIDLFSNNLADSRYRQEHMALRTHLINKHVALGTVLSVIIAASVLQSEVPVMPSIYAGGDGNDGKSQTDIAQDVTQKQKCKVGIFGDPEDSTSSTTVGFCNQQGQNNLGGGGLGGSFGSVGIPIGP